MQLSNSRNPADTVICHFLSHTDCHSGIYLEMKGEKEQVSASSSQAGSMERRSTGDILHLFNSSWFMYGILACLYLRGLICFYCCKYFRASS